MAKEYISTALTVLSLEIWAVSQAEFKQFIQKNSYLDLASGCISGMRIHKSFGLGAAGRNMTSFHPMCSSPMRKKDGNLRSFYKRFFWPVIFNLFCSGYSSFGSSSVSNTTMVSCIPVHGPGNGWGNLDVQTITNDQLLENTLLVKPSAHGLTHSRADEADESPLVFKKPG